MTQKLELRTVTNHKAASFMSFGACSDLKVIHDESLSSRKLHKEKKKSH